jgi:hypothetical protein
MTAPDQHSGNPDLSVAAAVAAERSVDTSAQRPFPAEISALSAGLHFVVEPVVVIPVVAMVCNVQKQFVPQVAHTKNCMFASLSGWKGRFALAESAVFGRSTAGDSFAARPAAAVGVDTAHFVVAIGSQDSW